MIIKSLVALCFAISLSFPAHAYIGPGLGLGVFGVIFGIIISIFLVLFSIFWFPIKKALKAKKNKATNIKKTSTIADAVHQSLIKIMIVIFIFFLGQFYSDLEKAGFFINTFNSLEETISDYAKIEDLTVTVYQPSRVHDEVIVICPTVRKTDTIDIFLSNNNGEIIHKWKQGISELRKFTEFDAYGKKVKTNASYCWDVKLLPDGNLLVMTAFQINYKYDTSNPNERIYTPSIISLLDKESNVIWSKIGNYNHHFDVNDKGEVFLITSGSSTNNYPIRTYGNNSVNTETTYITKIALKNGEIIDSYSLADAFINSNYKNFISSHEGKVIESGFRLDPYHLNSIEYIENEQANTHSFLNEGDLLLSIVKQDIIAILRPNDNKIVKAYKGPWRWQHDVKLTDSGNISMYDNNGEVIFNEGEFKYRQSRVLEFNPIDNSSIVHYSNTPGKPSIMANALSYFTIRDDYFMISPYKQARLLQTDKEQKPVWDIRLGKDPLEEYDIYTSLGATVIKSFKKESLSEQFLESIK